MESSSDAFSQPSALLSTTNKAGDAKISYANSVLEIITLLLISVFGTAGNILVIATICKERKLRIPGNYFMINMTVSDIIITAFSLPVIVSNIVREMSGDHVCTMQRTGFCLATAFLKVVALHVSWYSLAFIAVNRYYSVCRINEYATYFTKKRVITAICFVWVWVILINIPIMVGWAIPSDKVLTENSTEGYYLLYPRHGPPVLYDRSSHDCVLGVGDRGGYTYGNGFFVMSIPLVSIVFCYTLLYMEIVRSRRNMKAALNSKQRKRRHKKERKLSAMLSVVVLVFIVCWTPVIIYESTSSLDKTGGDKTRLVLSWLALSHSAMNPGLYAILSRAFRVGYKRILLTILSRILCTVCKTRVEENINDLRYSSSSISRVASTTLRKSTAKRVFGIRRKSHYSHSEADVSESRANGRTQNNRISIPDFLKFKREEDKIASTDLSKQAGATVATQSRAHENKITSTGLTVPKEKHLHRDSARSFVHAAAVESAESISLENSAARDTAAVVTVHGKGKADNTSKKKMFVPLLERLGDSNDAYTAEGIYLGEMRKSPNKDIAAAPVSRVKQGKTNEDYCDIE